MAEGLTSNINNREGKELFKEKWCNLGSVNLRCGQDICEELFSRNCFVVRKEVWLSDLSLSGVIMEVILKYWKMGEFPRKNV